MSPHKVFGNRWKVEKPIGEGGQSWVYQVSDNRGEISEPLVLKRLKNAKRLDRFQREIEAARQLNHPSIPEVITSSLDEPAYFVTKLFEGPTLQKLGQTSSLEALRIFASCCDVVSYAHSINVVHRDLKPDNIIWLQEEERPAILDFGLCYFLDEDSRITATMEQVGSRFYMAPELEAGRASEVSEKVDVYSLGKILYFLLSGRHLAREDFTGEFDLCNVLGDLQVGYVTNRILKKSIVKNPSKRVSAKDLVTESNEVHRLISEHYYPGTVGSICRFCGEDHYQKAEEIVLTAKTVRYTNEQIPFGCIVCNKCNHTAWFLKKASL